MDDPVMTTVAEPQTKPKRLRGARNTKAGITEAGTTTKGWTTAAGTVAKPQVGPAATERVPVPAPAPEMPRRQSARPRKALAPAVTPGSEANAKPPASPPSLTRSEALQILVDGANEGRKSALGALRELMNKCPEIWQNVGDLSQHAELAWTDLVAGDDRLMLESVKRFVDQMKGRLAGSAPTPVEQLLVQQVVLTWLASRYADIASAKSGPSSLGEAKMRLKRAESAQRRHLASLKMLTEVSTYYIRKR